MTFMQWVLNGFKFTREHDVQLLVAQRKNALQVLVTLAIEQGGEFSYVMPDCTYKGEEVGSWKITVEHMGE